jgi:hypothetical protein
MSGITHDIFLTRINGRPMHLDQPLKDGKEQLRSYTHATGAPLAMWCNGVESVAWHRKNPNYFVEIPDVPNVGQTIDDITGQPWTMQTLIEVEQRREIEGKRARSLKQLIEEMEMCLSLPSASVRSEKCKCSTSPDVTEQWVRSR